MKENLQMNIKMNENIQKIEEGLQNFHNNMMNSRRRCIK